MPFPSPGDLLARKSPPDEFGLSLNNHQGFPLEDHAEAVGDSQRTQRYEKLGPFRIITLEAECLSVVDYFTCS